MTKIKVKLEAFYGASCMGFGYSSTECLEVEVSEKELEALRKIGKEQISCEDIEQVLEDGDTTLDSLDNKLRTAFYEMVLRHWIYEDDEGVDDALEESMQKDIEDGLYIPEEHGVYVLDDEDYDEDYDEDDMEMKKWFYDMEVYRKWVEEHDIYFVAERCGVSFDGCIDNTKVNYEIEILND